MSPCIYMYTIVLFCFLWGEDFAWGKASVCYDVFVGALLDRTFWMALSLHLTSRGVIFWTSRSRGSEKSHHGYAHGQSS